MAWVPGRFERNIKRIFIQNPVYKKIKKPIIFNPYTGFIPNGLQDIGMPLKRTAGLTFQLFKNAIGHFKMSKM